uniref:Cuticular protein n=1 Tax=Daphnia galeata TaxID=27404 RepID=A0A8J2RYS0_9CRUS|nr:unnamed protein product [Daphnia galeata]
MKVLILIALVAISAADDYSSSYSSSSYSPSYSSPSYSAPSYGYSGYSAPSYTYTQKVLVYPPPYYKTVEYIGYTHGGKKGKKGVPVYKAVDKY